MDFKKLAVIFCFLQLTSCSIQKGASQPERLYFGNYALAICLGSAFINEAVQSDFNKSANGYMERGNMPIESFEELRLIIDKWLEKDYPSKHGGQVNSAKCFDFYHSNELSSLFEKYNPCSSKNNWLSDNDYKNSCSTSITKVSN